MKTTRRMRRMRLMRMRTATRRMKTGMRQTHPTTPRSGSSPPNAHQRRLQEAPHGSHQESRPARAAAAVARPAQPAAEVARPRFRGTVPLRQIPDWNNQVPRQELPHVYGKDQHPLHRQKHRVPGVPALWAHGAPRRVVVFQQGDGGVGEDGEEEESGQVEITPG